MKEIFAAFLSISLSASIMMGAALLLRLLFRKAPKSLLCVLWLLVFVRLLLPVQLEVPWSLRPETPIVTGEHTQLFIDAEPALQDAIPAVVPQQIVEGTRMVVVDYLAIATALWVCGIVAILIYTLVTYFRLHFWVREAIGQSKGVYVSANIETAFLLGYFRPRIYLPAGMDEENARLVLAHEQAHIRRGDNWLKLLGLIGVALHWYNPLVWLCCVLMYRDVEDACDETVVRKLDTEDRKAYSAALLACGQKSRKVFGCPVAFGEIGVRQRIVRVLNYRKPAAWVCVLLVAAILFTSAAFATDPVSWTHPEYYEELSELLGQPKDVVCAGLGITEADLEEEIARGIYDTPVQVEYQGLTLRIQLGFSVYNDLLSTFSYYKEYAGKPDEVAVEAVAMSKYLWKSYGKGYQWYEREDPERLRNITVEDLREKLAEDGDVTLAWEHWNLTATADREVRTYLDQIEVSSVWQDAYGEKAKQFGVSPHFYLDFSCGHSAFNDATYLMLSYRTGWQPGHYSTMVVTNE